MMCPICSQNNSENLVKVFNTELDTPILEELLKEDKNWIPEQGACTRCVDQAQLDAWSALNTNLFHFPLINGNRIISIPVRLRSYENFTGKGVTIGLIDSGFYPHPDLGNRILWMKDFTNPSCEGMFSSYPAGNNWHGTMTSVVCAGDGHLSGGLYKSLAPEANVVLLKVADENGRISGKTIAQAIWWVIENRADFDIKIINLSVTDDDADSYKTNEVDRAVEAAVKAEITVVAAAGNDEKATLKAPANSPHAITVGGLNDRNTLHPLNFIIYHSTFGETVDGTFKPDLIAPAIWIPAPILPGTKEHQWSELLFELLEEKDDRVFYAIFVNIATSLNLDQKLVHKGRKTIESEVLKILDSKKWISAHYQHADGTSFAAPIVSSVIAQMLEANPDLAPSTIRSILTSTSRMLPDVAVEKQGHGIVDAFGAVYAALSEHHELPTHFTPIINHQKNVIEFFYHHHDVDEIVVTGDFSDWDPEKVRLFRDNHGNWKGSIAMLPKGTYRYKYFINQKDWRTDPTNLFREPDGFGGFNSKLIIEE